MMEMHFRVLAGEMMSKGNGISSASVQYRRGVFAGMKMVLDQPLIAQAEIEREIKKELSKHGEE